MIGLDTNVLLRYIVQDDQRQADRAAELIEKCSKDDPGYVNHTVLCELVWVLKRGYRYTREVISRVIRQLLQSQELSIAESYMVWQALAKYISGNGDFADYLIGVSNKHAGCRTTMTFDVQAAKDEQFQLLGVNEG
jgi:predicted nucleic-acid-binding protein